METGDLFTIVGWVVLWALVIGAMTLAALRTFRKASILIQVCLVVLATVAVLVAGMVSAFNAMFISARDLEVMWYILAVAGLVAVALSVILGAGVARNVSSLVSIARRLGRGESLGRAAPGMNLELARLAEELEASSRSLAESREREAAIESARRELVAWISHDLRTPLAGIRAVAEALEDGMVSDVSGSYRKLIGQTDRMAEMVNDLLELSKIQAGTMRLRSEPVDLYDLASDAIADLMPLAERRNIRLDGAGARESMALADGPSLGRAVRNVVLNAVVYSRPGTMVHVSVGREDGDAVVAVQDGCGGIAEEDLPHLFETGWQKDPARTGGPGTSDTGAAVRDARRYTGAGVGLSIVAGIVKAHDGTVMVENVDGGCRFTLRLPAGTA
jgi:signal transduction histidine kinase